MELNLMALGAALAMQVTLAPCMIDGVTGPAKCGTYEVWEDRAAKAGRQIELSTIVLSSLEAARPDPFFMLQGGPGDAPSFNARFYSRVFQDIRRTRDLVLIDLRGTGKSAALTCPELAKPAADGVYDADLLSVPAVRACRERLAQRTDLRLYTTQIAVDDLEELRQALGYGPINLYGTSYGSRAAQVYMRRYPKSLRAVAMKGVVPPPMAMPASHARAGEDAWRALVARCANDPGCVRALAETALTGRGMFSGERLAAGFFLSVTCTEDVPYLPADADAKAAGTFGGPYRLEQQRAACREWLRGTVSADHRRPTLSAVPTLLLSGELDPVTPPSFGEEVARGLANGRHVVIRNNGHPIGNAEHCIGQMIGEFLDRGSATGIDVSCAAAVPAPPFVLPGRAR